MSILPSPPHIPLSPEPPYHHQYIHRQLDPNMKTILASSWRVLEQPPPPTLREILEAYKARGDGDREMLLAMLNAKSSEDQRLASYATLHRTMLDMYQAPHIQPGPPVMPLHVPDAHHSHTYSHAHQFPSPPTSYHHSPHAHVSQQLHHDDSRHIRHRADSSSSMTDSHDRRYATSSSQQPRKRRRSSRSPPPQYQSHARATASHDGMSVHDLPPSPYSSASSAQSSGGSPRSRESMAINSLLLNSDADGTDDTPKRNTSSERSTTTSRDR